MTFGSLARRIGLALGLVAVVASALPITALADDSLAYGGDPSVASVDGSLDGFYYWVDHGSFDDGG